MSDIIRLLPDSIANQIAAGEVVQRPASVVKELLENSIDAGATSIQLIVKEGGKTYIQIIDNGSGMSETDARMCFERHATSKISSAEDLFKIKTLGFRGEAMASIAAVAQVELKSKKKGEELGILICIEGSEIKTQEHVNTPEGTSICVKNLFFNIPARKNFLKSNPVETKHILDEFQRVALAHPEVSFSFHQNDLETYNLPSGKLSNRIVGLFGKIYQEQMASCQEETEDISIYGYIGKPQFSKKTRGEQFFFVNDRFIKNNYLHHAVMNAYEGLLADDQVPFYVLFINIDPAHIDINVHPTKTEIKFDDERMIYGVIRAAVKKSLSVNNIAPSLDFDLDVNFNVAPQIRHGQEGSSFSSNAHFPRQENNNLKYWESLYDNNIKQSRLNYDFDDSAKGESNGSFTIQSAANNLPLENMREVSEENKTPYQVHHKYIIHQIKSGIIVVDQQAAHERILYEKFLNALEVKQIASQQCLFPQALELNPADFSLVMELESEINAIGFSFSVFGKNTIVINGVPVEVQTGQEKELFEGLIEQFKRNKSELSLGKKDNVAQSLAKRSAMKAGLRLTPIEMSSLIDQLFACSNSNYSPSGELTFITFTLDKLEGFFNQRK